MRALHSTAAPIQWRRVAREHRATLLPLGVVLAINVVVLVAVVLPLGQRVAANEQRAEQAARAEANALAEYRGAEALREGKAQATKDLETFYGEVLPSNVPAARRLLTSKIQDLARAHEVDYERGGLDIETVPKSALERMVASLTLTGEYDDIRAMIYDLETAPEFIVIDNIVLSEGRENESLSWSMELSTYYRTAAARAGANGR
jgi:type II secretory pathway pseudopilin PulG